MAVEGHSFRLRGTGERRVSHRIERGVHVHDRTPARGTSRAGDLARGAVTGRAGAESVPAPASFRTYENFHHLRFASCLRAEQSVEGLVPRKSGGGGR